MRERRLRGDMEFCNFKSNERWSNRIIVNARLTCRHCKGMLLEFVGSFAGFIERKGCLLKERLPGGAVFGGLESNAGRAGAFRALGGRDTTAQSRC
jgi:hypothetical protein